MSSDPARALDRLADALIGASSSTILLTRLEEVLDELDALPARLWLIDRRQGVFYPAAAIGCPAVTGDLPLAEAQRPGRRILHHAGEAIGLLDATQAEGDGSRLDLVARLLGPVLVRVQQQERLVGELRQAHERTAHLLAAGRLLRHLDLEVLLVEILQGALQAVKAQVGAVLTPGPDGRQAIRTAWGLRSDHVDAILMGDGRRLVDAVAADRRTLRLTGPELAAALDLSRLEASLTGILALPLDTEATCHGVVLLANPESRFDEDSQRLADTVCRMAAIALDNARLVADRVERERLRRELDIARQVQAEMFPRTGLTHGALRVEGAFRPCDETGGDYLAFQERDASLLAMVGDVTGHGLGAALFTMAAHAIVQQQLRSGRAIHNALTALNTGIFHTHGGRFMTIAVVEVDAATGAFRYASAGHNPLLWLHGGEARWLPSLGMPVGILEENQVLLSDELTLAPGDCLVLYTDGFTEAFDPAGDCFGEERFAAAALAGVAAGQDAAGLIRHLFAAVEAWSAGAPPTDDLTLVVVQRAGG